MRGVAPSASYPRKDVSPLATRAPWESNTITVLAPANALFTCTVAVPHWASFTSKEPASGFAATVALPSLSESAATTESVSGSFASASASDKTTPQLCRT